ALVERSPKTMRIIHHEPYETPRTVQLYGVDTITMGQAVRMLVEEDRADHIDLNFGCPVPKVTRKGGGSALPWKQDLFDAIVTTAVTEASRGGIPVTVKMRKGIDADHTTFLDAAETARNAGVSAVALHGRTAARSEEHTSELQSRFDLVCRLLLDMLSISLHSFPTRRSSDLWKQDLFDAIVTTAVTEASRGGIPVTVKMRKGIDADHTTFLDAAETARNAGVSAVALHGRTAA